MDFTAEQYEQRDAARLAGMLAGPPLTWVFVGDSITRGVGHTRGRRNFVEHFAERLCGELGRDRDAIINSAVDGATVADVLDEFHWRIGRFAPDVVLAMYGTNDALVEREGGSRAFRYDLGQLVGRSRDLGATVILQTPPPVDAGDQRDPETVAVYAAEVRSVARELGVPLVDHAEVWREATTREPVMAEWLDDTVHPNARGQHALALALFERLGVLDPDSAVCSLRLEGAVASAP
ncbi:MAG: SGNH/GDSL hydrolase family protein [Intrasporangium sp.]|uniref:SGNH/GDSL hydrolase family protein n=1 Tax=Intrasporangium sp. TaxID=1925024 RepID=UPI002649BAE0|nr:SGNH/GDSL hydrolase family protein [Intrasporangium sp.]MDN5795566.1 SGNH/GDSL hydrolase family protein [Intrasporangium sp.]